MGRTSPAGLALALILLVFAVPSAVAGAPDWLRALARAPLPAYPDDTKAVVLLDETVITVQDNGDIKRSERHAYRILRKDGEDVGTVLVAFDGETRISMLKGWSIAANGEEYEVKEKDAIETGLASDALYADTRHKLLKIPAAQPGATVGFELERKERPWLLEDCWWLQQSVPVRTARYTLRLPAGWEYTAAWVNHAESKPRDLGQNAWLWELENVPSLESQPYMPALRALAGRLTVTFHAPEQKKAASHASWDDVGGWYWRLAQGRSEPTPAIAEKVKELTAGSGDMNDKVRAVATFVQKDIRYVAIEIGIGGHQPHAADAVFTSRYGDCKDKATLLGAMLQVLGVPWHYVLLHTDRGVVAPASPSARSFNHAIIAIEMPNEHGALVAFLKHPKFGNLLFFDPTSKTVAFGWLPGHEQDSHALLVSRDTGELVRLPLLPPSTNRLIRTAKLMLAADGTLSGDVHEVRWGEPAAQRRSQWQRAEGPAERRKIIEDFLSTSLTSFLLEKGQAIGVEDSSQNLVLAYRFSSAGYAKRAGPLLLVRPRVLGIKARDVSHKKERQAPLDFDWTLFDTDDFEIVVPEGYAVDELPTPTNIEGPLGTYKSETGITGNVLHYHREFQQKQVCLPVEQFLSAKKFFDQIADDEAAVAVLKRK